MQFRGWAVHVEHTEGPTDAEPMVLLHGFGSGCFTWRPALAAGLADGRRAVAFDRFGFGASARPRKGSWTGADDNPYALAAAVDLTDAVVDDTTTGSVVLVGQSAGALVAASYAASKPERVHALVLVAPALLHAGPPAPVATAFRLPLVRRWAPTALRAGRSLTTRAVERAWHDPARFRASGLDADYSRATAQEGWAEGLVELTLATSTDASANTSPGAGAIGFDAVASLHAIHDAGIRTLVVAGAHDRIVKGTHTERVAERAGARLHVVDAAGHVPHEERPADVVDAVARFLRAE